MPYIESSGRSMNASEPLLDIRCSIILQHRDTDLQGISARQMDGEVISEKFNDRRNVYIPLNKSDRQL